MHVHLYPFCLHKIQIISSFWMKSFDWLRWDIHDPIHFQLPNETYFDFWFHQFLSEIIVICYLLVFVTHWFSYHFCRYSISMQFLYVEDLQGFVSETVQFVYYFFIYWCCRNSVIMCFILYSLHVLLTEIREICIVHIAISTICCFKIVAERSLFSWSFTLRRLREWHTLGRCASGQNWGYKEAYKTLSCCVLPLVKCSRLMMLVHWWFVMSQRLIRLEKIALVFVVCLICSVLESSYHNKYTIILMNRTCYFSLAVLRSNHDEFPFLQW